MSAPLDDYFREAASWDADRLARTERALRASRVMTVLLAVLTLAAVGAVAALTPLKRVEPYLVRVNDTSGVVDLVPTLSEPIPYSEALSRYLISHYVTTCERYTAVTAEQDYAECGAFHGPERNQTWAASWATSNPDSPLNRYRDGSIVRADVKAVSFFERGSGVQDLAQVRFTRETRAAGGAGAQLTPFIATLQFAFGKPPTDPRTRRWNPLGFRVLDYRLEPEVPAAVAAAPVLARTPPTATHTEAATP